MSTRSKSAAPVVSRRYEPQDSACEQAIKQLVQKAGVVRAGEEDAEGRSNDIRATPSIRAPRTEHAP